MGKVLGGAAPGTGAHGQEWRDGKLWLTVPPSREVYRIDTKNWVVETKFPTAGTVRTESAGKGKIPVGDGFQSQRIFQARYGDRQNNREDSIE